MTELEPFLGKITTQVEDIIKHNRGGGTSGVQILMVRPGQDLVEAGKLVCLSVQQDKLSYLFLPHPNVTQETLAASNFLGRQPNIPVKPLVVEKTGSSAKFREPTPDDLQTALRKIGSQ